MTKVHVPQVVAEQLERIRQSGETNMLARNVVQVIADQEGFWELVLWIEAHPGDYARLIFHGMEVVADEVAR